MILGDLFNRFVERSPVTVMMRGAMEYALRPEDLDELFSETAERQYTRELLFSSVVDLTSLVVCRVRPSLHAAYKAFTASGEPFVSVKSLYNKINHMEPAVSSVLVEHSADRLLPVLKQMRAGHAPLLPGYHVKIVDGNHLAATEHRLKPLRSISEGALPGTALVVYDPQWDLILQTHLIEDGHAQERASLKELLNSVQANDVWVADRNFCTTAFLFGIANKPAFFIIRQHATNVRWRRVGRRIYIGRTDTGKVYAENVLFEQAGEDDLHGRRITLELDKPTRDGETEIHLFTNLPSSVKALDIADVYRKRWTIEVTFAVLEKEFDGEIKSLGTPRAALFAFCVALLAYNLLSCVKAGVRAGQPAEKKERKLSDYYVANEISSTYLGMMIAIPAVEWVVCQNITVKELAELLTELGTKVNMAAFSKHKRGPKKPVKKKPYNPKVAHVSTAKVLAGCQ
jgi:IS4 transposase